MVETRRQQIENTASELFRERGYAATSVRDIARALDMQGASLYAHVASKEDVLWSIVTRAADRFDAAVAPIAADATRPAGERLTAMIRAHIGVITGDLDNASSFLDEWRFLSDGRRESVADRRDTYEARFRDLIQEGVDNREFDAAADPRMAATLILSALNGVADWYRADGALTSDEIGNQFAVLLLAGLLARDQAARPVAAPATPVTTAVNAAPPRRRPSDIEAILR